MSVKKTISVAEFQEVVEREHYNSYQYSTENQPWDDGGKIVMCRQHLTFQTIHISPKMPGCPAVTFSGAAGTIAFLNVCKVERKGNVFTLYCKPWEGDMDCIGYSVIARNN